MVFIRRTCRRQDLKVNPHLFLEKPLNRPDARSGLGAQTLFANEVFQLTKVGGCGIGNETKRHIARLPSQPVITLV
jgi:hypothetical protein